MSVIGEYVIYIFMIKHCTFIDIETFMTFYYYFDGTDSSVWDEFDILGGQIEQTLPESAYC